MKRLIFKYTSLFAATAMAVFFTISCGVEEEPPTPIFAGTEVMNASYGGGVFSYSPSDDVEYVVLGIFNTKINTVGKSITNMDQLDAGSRTGMDKFYRNSVVGTDCFNYNVTTGAFELPNEGPTSGQWWAVWGFNADFVIIESSGQFQIP